VITPTREQALAHFGVKGMKWGVRKPTPGGKFDRVVFGKRGAASIANRTSAGQSATHARLVNAGRAAIRAIAVLYMAALVKRMAQVGVTNAVLARNSAKVADAGKKAIPAIMATAAKLKYAPLKGGAFVITTLK
jgi:hypothetical protein